MQVYEQLYDIVAENLQAADKNFEYRKTTFLCDVKGHPQDVDVSKYLHLSNEEFFQAIFVAAYKRLPEPKESTVWEEKYELPIAAFQTAVLRNVANSSVVAINHIKLINNPYFEQQRGLRYKVLGILYGLTDKSSLREFGKKLPQPIQKVIRKVFL
uniref:hypothetical protein n=1 Tax=Acetatifactor sp. TaxID=1872090 RepID=UPI0040560025